MEVSAKTGFNIEKIFKVSSEKILRNISENIIDVNDKVSYYHIIIFIILI
jgi:hypothetical protein